MRNRCLPLSLLSLLLVSAGTVHPQQNSIGVTEVVLKADGDVVRLRPLESVQLQVRAYGEVAKDTGEGKDRVRLQRAGAKLSVLTPNGGWVSKPFKFQGRDGESFYQDASGKFAAIFGMANKHFLLQDANLYTAPEQPGKYEIEADLDGKKGRITIEVAAGAPSRRPAETTQFPPETHVLDPYRLLAEHWAPMFAQESWFQPKADIPTRFDFDNDWHGDNNWDNMETGTSQAYVYYAAMETQSHWFLSYNAFHPRVYSDKCVAGSCHENDNEGLILTVRKDGSEFGKLEVMETLAHNNVYSFVNDSRLRKGAHSIDGRIEFWQQSHPVAYVESGGHGIYGSTSSHSKYDLANDKFTSGLGMTFVYKGVAERAKHGNDRLVGYELLPILDHWWKKSASESWTDRTFDEAYVYAPFGGRPAGNGRKMGGTFLGRKESSNKAKPFWGWHDTASRKKGLIATGQWGLDPAYAVSKFITFPAGEAPSVDYTYNPYLNIE
ncbi:MAG: hypothetical protein FJW30_29985 [Acidobacteria bacterium]|nr:hypothetical protein [Acidobacteriota bacterium]